MTADVHATLVRIQRQVVAHYNYLLAHRMPDDERKAVSEKLAREERILSELLAPGAPGGRVAA